MGWISGLRACWKCRGAGEVVVRGDRIAREDLTVSQYAEFLCEGTHFYRPLVVACPRCTPRR